MVRYEALKGFYELERTIGCGGFAKVKLATHMATGEKVAIKIMEKVVLGSDLPRIKLEMKALQSFSHENICKLYQVIETDTHFFIVMEYCSGGELFDHIIEKNRLKESESRMFFRQIVSAVAYLHSLGYAHRDLKPENILLDKYQNLKLIDFGLCAKPDGGMKSLLSTSCGSPTYAAPELVQGKQYLGSEVDIWAMGVLLYALLAGSLPFDDMNIDSLYKKIVTGKYEEPQFMSKESLALIRSMLQTNPKKRITITELLSHPWLTLGILDPVEFKTEDSKRYDTLCVKAMSNYFQVKPDIIWCHLKAWKYDYHTATYLLLLNKRRQGCLLKLDNCAARLSFDISCNSPRQNLEEPLMNNKLMNLKHPHTPKQQQHTPQKVADGKHVDKTQIFQTSSPVTGFIEPKQPSSIRKPMKRIRSPCHNDNSPIPTKKISITRDSTPVNTPDRTKGDVTDTPSSARKMLGSIERSFHKVVNVLTPRKTELDLSKPLVLTNKNMSNVSTTQCRDPEHVISELHKALEKKGVHCKRKGFTLRGKMEPTAFYRFGECSFELEVCYLPSLGLSQLDSNIGTPTKSILKKGTLNFDTPVRNVIELENSENNFKSAGLVGIRRKRLKGDAWCYKKVCEEVLALTATDFKSMMESSV